MFQIHFAIICHGQCYWDHGPTIDIWSCLNSNFRWLFTSFTVCGILTAMVIVYHETDFYRSYVLVHSILYGPFYMENNTLWVHLLRLYLYGQFGMAHTIWTKQNCMSPIIYNIWYATYQINHKLYNISWQITWNIRSMTKITSWEIFTTTLKRTFTIQPVTLPT